MKFNAVDGVVEVKEGLGSGGWGQDHRVYFLFIGVEFWCAVFGLTPVTSCQCS